MNTETTFKSSWKMPGGLRFGAYRADRISSAGDLPDPEEIYIPIGIPKGDSLVSEGDTVVTGQSLIPDEMIVPGSYHLSTVTGTVERFILHGKGMRAPSSVVIRPSGEDRFSGDPFDIPSDSATLRDFMIRTGVIHTCSKDVGKWIMSPEEDVTTLIIAGLSSVPQASGGIDSVEAHPEEFRTGLSLFGTLFPGVKTTIAVRADEFGRWHAIDPGDGEYRLFGFEDRYPLEHPVMLASTIGERDIAGVGSPVKAGIAVVDSRAVLSMGRAALSRRPLTHMRSEIFGEGVTEPTLMSMRIGTPVRLLLETMAARDVRVIAGGVMAGKELATDDPLLPMYGILTVLPLPKRRLMGFAVPAFTRHSWTRTVASSLLPGIRLEAKAEVGGELRPCISCGACEEVCPVSISPSFLFRTADAEIIEEMEQQGVERCIACGLCSYVCPSKIDLMGKIVSGIERLGAERAE